jgi:hypothetical protein
VRLKIKASHHHYPVLLRLLPSWFCQQIAADRLNSGGQQF